MNQQKKLKLITMKDTLKLVLVGLMSFVAIARSCVKKTRVAQFLEPALMEARYMKNAANLEREGESSINAFKVVKTAKDSKDVVEISKKITEKDSLKTNVKPVNAYRK